MPKGCFPRPDRCKHGHPLSGANLRRQWTEGCMKRRCRTCEARLKREHIIRKMRRSA